MRVVLSGTFFAWPATGTGQYTLRLARELESLVDELLVIPPRGRPAPPISGIFEPVIRHTSYVIRHASYGGASSPPIAGTFDQFAGLQKIVFEQVALPLAARRAQPDLLHVPYFGSPVWSPVPTVVTVHDLIMLVVPEHRGGLAVQAYTRLAMMAARRATLVLADSECTRRDILRLLGIPADRVRVVPLAADDRYQADQPPAALAAVRVRYDLPERFILYVGDLNRRKNLEALICAFRQVATDRVLAIAGRAAGRSSALYPDLAACARRYGVEDRVRFVGHVAEDDKPALYAACDLFVFPSRYEGFGLTPLEAMAAGAPVVCSNAASLPEVVGDGGILVEPTEDALASAMGSVLADPALADRLRHAGKARAKQFTWRRTAELTVAAYEDAIKLAERLRLQ
ncbi:MAG: glycosyltransferase family 4 protein [Chloroflexi bacterium]|nr:glycosyltransferase family 4 protein [Chloroflexota bacterium]